MEINPQPTGVQIGKAFTFTFNTNIYKGFLECA